MVSFSTRVLRVPLIVRVPGERPGLVGGLVRLVDIMPTILHIVGIVPPPVDGVSLVQLMRGRSRSDLEAYAESTSPQTHGWAPLFSLRNGRFKFIDAPQPELYDLQVDPLETRNLFQQRPPLAAAMQARLKAERLRDVRTEEHTFVPNDEVRTRLGALGYSSGRTPGAVSTLTDLPDPKSCTGVFEAGRCR
jgi:arylsulfatase A-like enzyme